MKTDRKSSIKLVLVNFMYFKILYILFIYYYKK